MTLRTELHKRSPYLFRLLTFTLGACMLTLGLLSAYWLWSDVLPLFGRIYRNAPVVETPYLGFMLIAMCAVTPIIVLACTCATWQGRKFDPPPHSKLFKFQCASTKATVWSMLYIAPALAISVTLVLWWRDYSPCPELLISGSAWQLFWVNDERYCFKPDFYINENWPCKRIENKDICVQVDGRQ